MATTVLELQTLTGFVENGSESRYYQGNTDQELLVVGHTYHISLDGTDYTCVAKIVDGVPALGNPGIFGGEDSGEPFLIGIVPGDVIGGAQHILMIYSTDVDSEEHILGITVEESAEYVYFGYSLPFTLVESMGLYLWQTWGDTETYPNPKLFDLVDGETYRIIWDGVTYDCVARYVASGGIVGVGIGNLGMADLGEDTGEPFVLGVFSDGTNTACYATEKATSHSFILYHLTDSGNGIVLKNYNGVDVTYENVDAVMFDTPDGGTQVYTRGELITGVYVSLDLKDGNQTVTTPEGTLAIAATIIKPETLMPENIRNGTTIAGVKGEFLGDTEELTLPLSMADGDMIVDPSSQGKVLSRVTVTKPSTLIPANIVKGVTIGGVEGSYIGSGSGDGTLDDRLNKTIVSAAGSATMIPSYAFHACQSLKAVSYPEASIIHTSAFFNCTALSEISFPACKTVGSFAFSWCTALSVASFPTCTTISSSAFISCTGLTNPSFPNCTTIGYGAFSNCTKLSSISFPKAAVVSGYAFYNCTALLSADLPVCTTLPNYAFAYCKSMLTLNAPLVTTIQSSTFFSCIKLKNVNMPKLTAVPSYGFRGCNLTGDVNFAALKTAAYYGFFNAALSCISSTAFPELTTLGSDVFRACYAVSWAYLPAAATIGSRAFYGLYKMSWASLPAATYFYASAFFSCTHLKSLYLLGSSFATLQNSSVFSQTAMNLSTYIGEYGSIFVRESMLASYQTRAYWSYYSSRFVGLTDEEIAALEETT